jgi:serine/threonine protein kinase
MTATASTRIIADRYRLTVPIGSGGVGVVWSAQDVLLDRVVAVKEIVRAPGGAAAGGDWDETYQRTLREARAAARIRHSGVAAVYDVVSEDDRPYIVMELIEGRPLAEIIEQEGPLPAARIADIGRQILDALIAGHAAGVLHRDLKPANVLITAQDRAVLTDFGIASVAGDPSLTQTGVVLGTPSYLAPERARGESTTAAADLWSLGATLYAAANGRGPFDGYDGAMATMYAIITEDPPALPAGPLTGIIGSLLARDPGQRPDAAETARALAEAVSAPELPVTEPPELAVGESISLSPSPRAAVQTSTVSSALPLPEAFVAEPEPLPFPVHRRVTALVGGLAALVVTAATVTAVLLTSSPASHHVSLSGSGAPVPVTEQFRVAAVVVGGGSELFAQGRDDSLRTGSVSGGSWSGWTSLPGGTIFAGVPAVASSPAGLFVFDRTTSGSLEYLWQATPGSGRWKGPVTLGSTLVSSDPSVVTWPDGRIQVFARLGSGAIGTDVLRTAGGQATAWQVWRSLGGDLAGPPVAAMDSTGHPQVFGLAPDGSLQVDAMTGPVTGAYPVGQWTGWRQLPGGRGEWTGLPAVGRNKDGRLEVFARTRADVIEHVWQAPGSPASWGGPQPLIPGGAGDPSVFSTKGGRLEVFVTALDGTVRHTWQNWPVAGTNWAAPQSLGGSSDAALTPLAVGQGSELFARAGGTIRYDHLLNPGMGSWLGWSGLGGSF